MGDVVIFPRSACEVGQPGLGTAKLAAAQGADHALEDTKDTLGCQPRDNNFVFDLNWDGRLPVIVNI